MTGGDLQLDKPVSLFLKPVRIPSYKDFFGSLSRMFVHSLALDAPSAVTDALDVLASLSLAKEPEEIAWTLVNRAMGGAIARLLQDNRNNIEIEDSDAFAAATSFVFGEREIVVDASLFDDPGQSSVVREMESILRNWLRAAGLNEGKTASIVSRLRSYFVFALHDEWRKNEPSYRALHEYLKTPFSGATEYEHAWNCYTAYLEKQIHEGVFGETFSLAQLFISPNASYEIPGEKAGEKPDTPRVPFDRRNADSRKAVVNLEECLVEWLGKDDRNDAVRVLRGGPGYGKSSFSKMFAAKQSKLRRVLYLPLHQLELKNDLAEEIGRVCRESYGFKTNPYATEHKLLIIFDGLDELTQQGKVCVELAQQFINELLKKIERKNHSETKLQTIITGRDLVVQSNESNFRKQGQILSMLPYRVADEEKQKYDDPQSLLNEDKRKAWWENYGELTGRHYPGMPEELGAEQFDELTVHPILNYLLALSYERGNVSFDEGMNINTLYADCIDAIHNRAYEGERRHAAVGTIGKTDFIMLLEEIAVSAWHGLGHTATIESIIARCKDSSLHSALEHFQNDAKKGISNLLLSFYFQQSEVMRDGEKTFEFTHKSFSEYLVAKRIVRQLRHSHKQYTTKEFGERNWNAGECLRRWIILCGVAPLDHDIARFIQNEMLLMEVEEAREIQRFLCELIQYVLERGLPFDSMPARPAFREELRQSVNAEQALLVSLSSCAQKTDEISKIAWPDETSACKWLCQMQKKDSEIPFVNHYLNHMDFTGCGFDLMDFFDANLEKSLFNHSRIWFSVFCFTNFKNTQLSNATVFDSCFEQLSFTDICFHGTMFRESKFSTIESDDCNFKEAEFYSNTFDDSEFCNCNFEETIFSLNILENTDFKACNFENVQLEDNNMTKALVDMNSIIHPDLNPNRNSVPEGED